MSKNSSTAVDRRPRLILLCGPTAVGKSALALDLASRFPLEIVSADSRQVYRGMDIGTAKPTAEEQAAAPHHLLDVVDPDDPFSVADFIQLTHQAIDEIVSRGKVPLVVGGTGLYWQLLTDGLVSAPGADPAQRHVLQGLAETGGEDVLHQLLRQRDPEAAARIQPRDNVRIIRALEVLHQSGQAMSQLQQSHGFNERPYRVLKLGLFLDRQELYRRIDRRVEEMLHNGLFEEVERLLGAGLEQTKALRTIGYQEVVAFLQEKLGLQETIESIQRNSRRYAKRQLTWMRRDKRMIWLDSSCESDKICKLIGHFIA